MGHLLGLDKYLDEKYGLSVFDKAFESKEPWALHLHNDLIITTRIIKNQKYDIEIEGDNKVDRVLPKINVKIIYPAVQGDSVRPLVKTDKKVRELKLEPILSPRNRNHIKNKSLFPLMHERKVVLFTLLEGEILKGLIVDFSLYDVTIRLKGGIPVTILRHAVYDLKDKKGRCFLKNFQETSRDWEKSSLYGD